MISYSALGLSNTKKLFRDALVGRYAIPAYNFNNMEQLQAIVRACVETRSPVILQISSGSLEYITPMFLRHMAQAALEYARSLGTEIPIVLHLDHGDSFELCEKCILDGFSSVMIDGSHLPFDENVALTKRVVDFAHGQKDYVSVEGELGVLAGIEDEIQSDRSSYTRPEEVEEFVRRTGVDSLAISIGTSHGATKFKPSQCKLNEDGILTPPPLRFDILEQIERMVPGFPIVLHGSSSVPIKHVKMFNSYGGVLKDAMGIPEDQLRQAAKSAVCKVNIDSDARLTMSAVVRKILSEKPAEFHPREYLGPARDALVELYKNKNTNVLGCANRI